MSGNESFPIIVMAKPGDRATIVGKIDIDASYLWLVRKRASLNTSLLFFYKKKIDLLNQKYLFLNYQIDIEVTDPENTQTVSNAIDLRGNYSRVINCFVHDTFHGNGIVAHAGAL